MKAWTNRAELIGAFEGEPEYSHTAHDRNFYKARLMCVRHSGKADYIPIIIPESKVDFKHTYKDDFCAITGQVRTYNNRKTNRLEMTPKREVQTGLCHRILGHPILHRDIFCIFRIFR